MCLYLAVVYVARSPDEQDRLRQEMEEEKAVRKAQKLKKRKETSVPADSLIQKAPKAQRVKMQVLWPWAEIQLLVRLDVDATGLGERKGEPGWIADAHTCIHSGV